MTHADTLQDDGAPHTPAARHQAPVTPVFSDTSDPGYPSPPDSYPDYMQQSGGSYPPQGPSFPGFGPPPGTGYTATAPERKRNSNLALKLVILVILLLALGTLALFVMQPDKLQSFLGGHSVATPTTQPTSVPPTATAQPSPAQSSPTAQSSQTPVLTPEQEAQAVITQYYTDINNKNYRAAYNLWANYPQSYETFAQGFAHTRHDDIGFGNSAQQGDGTVRVPVVNGHSESVHVQFHRPMHAAEAKELLRHAEGVVLMDEPYAPGKHPQPIHAAGTDPVYVGRIRDDLAVKGALNLWIVSDNLRKGAALNAVQIAERLFVSGKR